MHTRTPPRIGNCRRLGEDWNIQAGLALRPWRYGQEIDRRSAPVAFLERLLLHYKVYRGYPLPPWPAFKNAWRIAFR